MTFNLAAYANADWTATAGKHGACGSCACLALDDYKTFWF